MKRIVNGVTYNTQTSTRLARRRLVEANESEKLIQILYQTRGGAFFVVEANDDVWNEESRSPKLETFGPLSRIAPKRRSVGCLKAKFTSFKIPSGTRRRQPLKRNQVLRSICASATLKRAADSAARHQNLSGNVWAMRCIEHCLEGASLVEMKIAPLARKLADGDKGLAVCFQNAKLFWKDFFEKNSQRSVSAIAKELASKQHAFEAIFEDYGRHFAKEMMPLTCLGYLYDEGGDRSKNRPLARKVVEGFKKSLVSGEIKGPYLDQPLKSIRSTKVPR